jgi:Cu2+-exporting ATPase
VPEFLRATAVYDVPEIQDQFVHSLGADMREASLILEGITCAACIWLNEQYIAGLPGVTDVRVNYATQRALVRWDETRIKLSEILQSIQKIGYRALPYNPDQQQESNRQQRRLQLRRLAVAGLFGMQVMMISISLYAGAWSGMEASFEQFFRWLSLGLTLPVMLYSATPFFISAGRDLARRQVGMDVPVSLAIGIAFASSALATINGQGEIYFDSVVMFVFFLSASRYFENMARQRCAA